MGVIKIFEKVINNEKERWRTNRYENFQRYIKKLINDDRVKFKFYNNSLLDLDLLQICYNKTNDTIELEFIDVMGEYLEELKKILKNKI